MPPEANKEKKEKQRNDFHEVLGIPEERWRELHKIAVKIITTAIFAEKCEADIVQDIMEVPDLTEKERVAMAYKIGSL